MRRYRAEEMEEEKRKVAETGIKNHRIIVRKNRINKIKKIKSIWC